MAQGLIGHLLEKTAASPGMQSTGASISTSTYWGAPWLVRGKLIAGRNADQGADASVVNESLA